MTKYLKCSLALHSAVKVRAAEIGTDMQTLVDSVLASYFDANAEPLVTPGTRDNPSQSDMMHPTIAAFESIIRTAQSAIESIATGLIIGNAHTISREQEAEALRVMGGVETEAKAARSVSKGAGDTGEKVRGGHAKPVRKAGGR